MSQTWNAETYDRHGRFVATLASDVLNLLSPEPGERILDLGCGDGFLSEQIRRLGATVVGLDSSPDLVRAAVQRGLDARLGNGEQLLFQAEFDAVFSNAALHWMLKQPAVLTGVHRALRPGGRFIAEMGGHGNVAAIRTALRAVAATFGLATELTEAASATEAAKASEAAESNVFFTAAEYRTLLEAHGFHVETIDLIPRPTPLPTGLSGWIQTFRRSLLDRLQPEEQRQLILQTTDLLRPILCDRSGQWHADYVRMRFHAVAQPGPWYPKA